MTGRPNKLTPEKAADARRRYQLFLDNRPSKIASELGISKDTLRWYTDRRHKRALGERCG